MFGRASCEIDIMLSRSLLLDYTNNLVPILRPREVKSGPQILMWPVSENYAYNHSGHDSCSKTPAMV